MKNGTIVLLFVMSNAICTAQIEIMKNFKLGEYSVGFRNERITDYSRSYEDTYRSIQLFVWYPTKEKSQKKGGVLNPLIKLWMHLKIYHI